MPSSGEVCDGQCLLFKSAISESNPLHFFVILVNISSCQAIGWLNTVNGPKNK